MSRSAARALLAALALAGLAASSAAAQRRPPAGQPPRFWLTGFAGRFTDFGGFSDDENTFFSFDETTGYGGSLHVRSGLSAQLGADFVLARPRYTRFDRATQDPVATGDATMLAALASVRLSGSGGGAGIFLAGSAGAVFWDVAELGARDTDPALTIGIGLDYPLRRSLLLFGEYGQWWVYHQKDDSVTSNTANHTLLRLGLRFGIGA